MIKEIFLTAALTLPLESFTFGPKFIEHRPSIASLLGVTGHVLHVVNGKHYVEGVGTFKAKPSVLPFINETFGILFWEVKPENHPFTFTEVWNNWMSEAMRLIMPGGFILFNEGHYVRWGKLLEAFGWTKLPFSVHQMSIYQKPIKLSA